MGGCAGRQRAPIRPYIRGLPVEDDLTVTERENLESYYLFWLDSTARAPEFMEAKDELRGIINYIKIFESNEDCEKEFRKIRDGKIFLMVNYTQSSSLLPRIHNHRHLYSIYIYHNHETTSTNMLTNQFHKIRGTYDSFSTAKRYLEDDIKIHTDIDDPMIIDIVDNDTSLDYQEMFNLFLKIVNSNANDVYDSPTRNNLINTYMEYYEGNANELNFIEDFADSYKPDKAIAWYMRGSCLHRLLSHAFVKRDMRILVDMYSFIVDINRDIKSKSVNQQTKLRVFRGQFISNETFLLLKENINKTMTMQCFFSTQTSRDEIVQLLHSIEPMDKAFRRMIFEIDATHDYMCINNSQAAAASQTILFMLGAVFRIIDVTETTIIMSQCSSHINGNYDLENESPLIIRGILTYLKKGPNEAMIYFERVLHHESEANLAIKSSIYGQLAYLQHKLGDRNQAKVMYEKSVHHATMQFGVYVFYLDQAANYYANELGDWEKAMGLWIQKLNIENNFSLNEGKAQTYENLARAAQMRKQDDKVIEYTLAAIDNLPNDHPYITRLQNQLKFAKRNLSKRTTD